MLEYLTRRVLRGLLACLGVLIITFVLMRLTGDPVALLLGDQATAEDRAELRRQLGLDQPTIVQFGVYLERVAQGDFGRSLRLSRPAMDTVLESLPHTLKLSALALGFAVVVGIPLGVLAARLAGTLLDRLVLTVAVAGQSMPSFWVGTMLIILVAVQLKLLPTSGIETPQHFILPAFTLAAYPLASITRLTRSGMLEVLLQDYIRTARAKGLGEGAILGGHALRNALIPLATFIGLELGVLAGGAVITETVFAVPGVGRLLVQSIFGRDYPVVQAAIVLIASLVVALNLVVDLLYTVLDPRVRLR